MTEAEAKEALRLCFAVIASYYPAQTGK